jgi:hypothetical protein
MDAEDQDESANEKNNVYILWYISYNFTVNRKNIYLWEGNLPYGHTDTA